jgi:hypothetical protein
MQSSYSWRSNSQFYFEKIIRIQNLVLDFVAGAGKMKARRENMEEQRYSINPDKDVNSSFWIPDVNGDWVKRDGIYYHCPLVKDQVTQL